MAIPFLFLFVVLVGFAFISLSQPMAKAFTSWMRGGGILGSIIGHLVGDPTIALARWISNRIGAAIADSVARVGAWFGATYNVIAHVFTSALMWPIEMFRLQEWLVVHEIPRLIRALTHGSTTVVTVGAKRLTALQRAIVAAERFVLGRIRPIAHAAAIAAVAPVLPYLHWLRHHVAALAHAIPQAIPWHYPRDWTSTQKRLRKLERLLAAGVGVAAVTAALARLGVNWIRCTKVKRLGKKACGFDDSWIGSFIADALLITSALSIVELTKDLQKITPAVADGIGYFVREAPAGFHAITDAERAAAHAIASEADSIINRL